MLQRSHGSLSYQSCSRSRTDQDHVEIERNLRESVFQILRRFVLFHYRAKHNRATAARFLSTDRLRVSFSLYQIYPVRN